MKSREILVLLVLAIVAALVLVACGGAAPAPPQPTATAPAPAEEATPAGAAETGEKKKFVYVSPNPLGVNDFLIMGQTGIEEAARKWNADVQVLESEDPTTREENVRAAVNEGADIVMVLGFEFNDIIAEVAPEAPDVEFLIVDQCIENPPENVSCAVFREHEAAFLVGAVAGLLTESNHLGVISALDIPFLHRYTDGFAAGARHVKPDVTVDTLWVGSDVSAFSDPARAKEQALALAGKGADHIFAAAAASNYGIFEAAEEQGFSTYGVDVNQCPAAPGHVVENLIKRVDVAVVQAIDEIMGGSGETFLSYGLKEGGVGLVALNLDNPEQSQCVIMEHPDVTEKVKGIRQEIIDGKITVEDPMFAR